jgi:hypothetical protein
MEFLPDTDEFPEKLVLSSSLNFRISDNIISQGWINFKPAKADGEKDLTFPAKPNTALPTTGKAIRLLSILPT